MFRMKMIMLSMAALVLCLGAGLAQAQTPSSTAFQVNYFAGAQSSRPDQQVRITNTGEFALPGNAAAGDECANIYVFRPDQQLAECCSCLVTPNGLRTISVNYDLTYNPLTGTGANAGAVGEGVIKIVGSPAPGGGPCSNGRPGPGGTPPTAGTGYTPVSGLVAWGTHNQDVSGSTQGANVINQTTETQFAPATLSPGELANLQTDCAFLFRVGSGAGVCTCGRGD